MTPTERDFHDGIKQHVKHTGGLLPETVYLTSEDEPFLEGYQCWYPSVRFIVDHEMQGRLYVAPDPDEVN